MTKKYKFSVLGDITDAASATGVGYSFDVKGKTIKQGSVGSDGAFSMRFKNKKKALKGSIAFEDLNGANTANFTNGGLEYSLAAGESSNFKAKAKSRPKAFRTLSHSAIPFPPSRHRRRKRTASPSPHSRTSTAMPLAAR